MPPNGRRARQTHPPCRSPSPSWWSNIYPKSRSPTLGELAFILDSNVHHFAEGWVGSHRHMQPPLPRVTGGWASRCIAGRQAVPDRDRRCGAQQGGYSSAAPDPKPPHPKKGANASARDVKHSDGPHPDGRKKRIRCHTPHNAQSKQSVHQVRGYSSQD